MLMTWREKADQTADSTEAAGKLGRLLQTEATLEAMLKETKQQAQAIIETARRDAEARIRGLESHLANEHHQLRERIERERDQTIASIREEAEVETQRLTDLDDQRLRQLAQQVVDVLVSCFAPGELP
jgi:F0F1-type ATP synthase membrane subunit b/b'